MEVKHSTPLLQVYHGLSPHATLSTPKSGVRSEAIPRQSILVAHATGNKDLDGKHLMQSTHAPGIIIT